MEKSYSTRNQEDIQGQMEHILASPKQAGTVNMLVIRPDTDARKIVSNCHFSFAEGMAGDRWFQTKAEGDPERSSQITLMNARMLSFIASDDDHKALAGDNLVVDFDLTEDNLLPGDKIQVGEVVFEVTDRLHKGCKKFAERFGPEALKFINTVERRPLHLRGIYVRVAEAGTVQVGDSINKL
ncbi:MAG: MOSC domain-containing protein [Bacteroidota bacterium]